MRGTDVERPISGDMGVSTTFEVTSPEVVRGLPGHWVANESPDVLTYPSLPEPPDGGVHCYVLALDGTPLAWTRGHGQAISWFG